MKNVSQESRTQDTKLNIVLVMFTGTITGWLFSVALRMLDNMAASHFDLEPVHSVISRTSQSTRELMNIGLMESEQNKFHSPIKPSEFLDNLSNTDNINLGQKYAFLTFYTTLDEKPEVIRSLYREWSMNVSGRNTGMKAGKYHHFKTG